MRLSFNIVFIIFLISLFPSCKEIQSRPLSYYLDTADIIKVEISNVRGKKVLSDRKLTSFKEDFSKCTTEPNLEIKTGNLTIILTLKSGESYVVRGDSQSDYLEMSSEIVTRHHSDFKKNWLVLNTNGTNFHNY